MANVEFFLFQSNNFCIWSCELLNKAKVNRLLFVDYLVAIDLAARELTSLATPGQGILPILSWFLLPDYLLA